MDKREFFAIEVHDGERFLGIGDSLISLSAREWLYAAKYYLRWWTPYTLLWIVRNLWLWLVRWPLWYAEMMLDRGKPFIRLLQLRAENVETRLKWCLRSDHKVTLRVVASNAKLTGAARHEKGTNP